MINKISKGLKSTTRILLRLDRAVFIETPVFVVACGRSGSTALCEALGTHPKLLMATQEAPLVHRIGEIGYDYALGRKFTYYQNSIQIESDRFRQSLKHQCYASAFGPDLGYSYSLACIQKKNSAFSRGRHLKLWAAKAFPSEKAAQGLLWLYPNCKFIYLFRNGLEVVHSMSKFGSFTKLRFTERCHFWSDRVFQYEYLRGHDRALTIKFEDLLMESPRVFERMYSHLEVPSDPQPLEYISSTLVHPLGKATIKANPKEVLLERRQGYEDWNSKQRETFKSICAKAMTTLGYEIPF